MPVMTPIHPGEILLKEFLTPLNLSQYRLAKDISVPPRRLTKSFMASAPSPQTRLFGYLATSEPLIASGSIYRRAMI